MLVRTCLGALALVLAAAPAFAQKPEKPKSFLDAATAGPEFEIQGEYEGTIGKEQKLGAQVVALGEGKFDAVLYFKGLPGAGWDRTKVPLHGETKDGVLTFTGTNFTGTIKDGVFSGTGDDNAPFQVKKVLRQSPTLGAKAPEGATVLFDGSNADAWVNGKLEEGNLLGVGVRTKQAFKNYTLHLEFRTPFTPAGRGQGRGNSGMYLNDMYEFQVLDSFGLTGENNECGGYYKFARPAVNMCLPPLSWQTYDVEFRMAEFGADGKKTKPAVATVKHNGVVIHDKYSIPEPNGGGGQNDEAKPGPIFLQDHGDPVRYRNVWIIEQE
jgi:hypothetical protein